MGLIAPHCLSVEGGAAGNAGPCCGHASPGSVGRHPISRNTTLLVVGMCWHLGDGELVTGLAAHGTKGIGVPLSISANTDKEAALGGQVIRPTDRTASQGEARDLTRRRGRADGRARDCPGAGGR